jgi:hypothetical protein
LLISLYIAVVAGVDSSMQVELLDKFGNFAAVKEGRGPVMCKIHKSNMPK